MLSLGTEPVLTMVSTIGDYAPFARFAVTAPSSATFETANRAVYYPLLIPTVCTARRVWWANGSTVSASYNVDCGIYADAGRKPGAKLVSSGSTAQGTASQVQFVDVTDTVLAPGLYWVALACSSASATFFTRSGSTGYDAIIRFQEATAIPLPSTATPVEASASSVYVFGFATTASP